MMELSDIDAELLQVNRSKDLYGLDKLLGIDFDNFIEDEIRKSKEKAQALIRGAKPGETENEKV